MSDAQTHFVAVCPHCSAGLKIRRAYIGQQVRCKRCDEVFVAEERPDGGGAVPGETPIPPVEKVERIIATCPRCRTTLSVRRAYIGRQVRCKQCDEAFLVADPSDIPPSAPSDNQAPADDGSAIDREELERLRGELDRVSGEYQRLETAHRELQAAERRHQNANAELQAAQCAAPRIPR